MSELRNWVIIAIFLSMGATRSNAEEAQIKESPNNYILSVCSSKGGATDYVVEWIISGKASLRRGIHDVGDEYPDWVSER